MREATRGFLLIKDYLLQPHFFSSKYLRSANSPCLPMLKEEIGRWYPITRVQISHFVRSSSFNSMFVSLTFSFIAVSCVNKSILKN